MRAIAIAVMMVTLGSFASSQPASSAESALVTRPVLLEMIRDDLIHAELGLTASQIDQVRAAHAEVDRDWVRTFTMPEPQKQQQLTQLTAALRERLDGILNAEQKRRISQLECQALGTRMFLRPDVISVLGIDANTQRKLTSIYQQTDEAISRIEKRQYEGELTPAAAQRDFQTAQSTERKSVVAALSKDQQAKIGSLTGQPFDFTQLKRTLPLAPELVSEGATFLQGGPIDLEELRGKVVALHFYAFQCINCQRNFPHYRAWHDDYADDGLVILGIQSPETSAERDAQRVATAMKKDGFEFPVIMDGEMANWNAWGNTMWPTVYLIDKDGFIRRQWRGEMNWKGTPGEQMMRGTIEELLAEDGN